MSHHRNRRAVVERIEPRLLLSTAPTQQVAPITAVYETTPVTHTGDAADDVAIWVNPIDPSKSAIVGTDKAGAISVYSPTGTLVSTLTDAKYNNVDLRTNFSLGGKSVTLVAATDVYYGQLDLFTLDPSTRTLTHVEAAPIKPGIVGDLYGLTMHRSAAGDFYAYVNTKDGWVEQFELLDNGSGKVSAVSVRKFDVGTQVEGMVADDFTGAIYIGEETVGIWKYGAAASAGTSRTRIDSVGATGRLTADVEGLAIYDAGNGRGYLIASSQGSNDYVVYDRVTGGYVTRFAITAGSSIDGVSNTDGIDVTSASLGGALGEGAFIAQDGTNTGGNQNFKIVSWGAIARAQGVPLLIGSDSPTPMNQSPVADAGADQAIALPITTAALSGSVADDAFAGTNLTVKWSVVSKPANASVIFNNASAVDTAVTLNTVGTYVLRLSASDGQYTDTDDVQVTLLAEPINTAPKVSAGADQTLTLPSNTVSLKGSATDDTLPPLSTISFGWSVVNKPTGATVSFASAASAATTATFSAAGVYTLRLTASDGALAGVDDVIVTVNAAAAGKIGNLQLAVSTSDEMQHKLWAAHGTWWAILSTSTGAWVHRLDGNAWTAILKLTNDTNARADTLAVGNGDVVHAVMNVGSTVKLVSLQYAAGAYQLWSPRPTVVALPQGDSTVAATLEIDSTHRMWIVYDSGTSIIARYSDGNYSSWSSPIPIASGVTRGDVASVIKMNGRLGVFWSNLTTKKFGFRTHVDGSAPGTWTADELPGASSALNLGSGLANDHLSLAFVDGTLYAAIKTNYGSAGETAIGLLVRRSTGAWDKPLYRVDTAGTRPTLAVIDGAVHVVYTATSSGNGSLVARKITLTTTSVTVGPKFTLLSGKWNDATTTRQTDLTDTLIMVTNTDKLASTVRL